MEGDLGRDRRRTSGETSPTLGSGRGCAGPAGSARPARRTLMEVSRHLALQTPSPPARWAPLLRIARQPLPHPPPRPKMYTGYTGPTAGNSCTRMTTSRGGGARPIPAWQRVEAWMAHPPQGWRAGVGPVKGVRDARLCVSVMGRNNENQFHGKAAVRTLASLLVPQHATRQSGGAFPRIIMKGSEERSPHPGMPGGRCARQRRWGKKATAARWLH